METDKPFYRTRWAVVGATAAVILTGGMMTATALTDSGEKPIFVAITPCRVMDTRPAPATVGPRSTPIGAGQTHTIAVRGANGACTIPADASSLSMNVTAVNPTANSYLTVFPADAPQPLASNLNYSTGQSAVPNAVVVDISADGKVSFFNNAGTVDVVADINGYYVDHNHDDRYYTKTETDAQHAKQKYLNIDITGTYGTGNTIEGIQGSVGLNFTDNSAGISVLSFVAPPDLTPNTNMTLRMTYAIQQTNCTIRILPNAIFVSRPGETAPVVPDYPDPVPGFVIVGADPRPAPSPLGTVGVVDFTLGRPLNGAGLSPGDAVALTFGRGTDTCTSVLVVAGVQVLYT